MAGEISTLSPLTSWASGDLFEVVDVSDTSMAAAGTNKKITLGDLFGTTTAVPVDLSFASGKGIKLGNEVLTEYDEGTFTPTLVGTSSGEASYNSRAGVYTRIGRICQFQIRITFTKGTVSGSVLIGGLPFTANASGARASVQFGVIDEIAFSGMITGDVNTSTTNIRIQEVTSGAAVGTITDADLHATNEMIIGVSGTYTI